MSKGGKMSKAVLRIVKAPHLWRCRCGREIPATQQCGKLGSRILCLECLKSGLPSTKTANQSTKKDTLGETKASLLITTDTHN